MKKQISQPFKSIIFIAIFSIWFQHITLSAGNIWSLNKTSNSEKSWRDFSLEHTFPESFYKLPKILAENLNSNIKTAQTILKETAPHVDKNVTKVTKQLDLCRQEINNTNKKLQECNQTVKTLTETYQNIFDQRILALMKGSIGLCIGIGGIKLIYDAITTATSAETNNNNEKHKQSNWKKTTARLMAGVGLAVGGWFLIDSQQV